MAVRSLAEALKVLWVVSPNCIAMKTDSLSHRKDRCPVEEMPGRFAENAEKTPETLRTPRLLATQGAKRLRAMR